MGDVMLFGILQMPEKLAMHDPLSRHQFYSATQTAVDRLQKAETENAALRERLATSEKLINRAMWYIDRSPCPNCGRKDEGHYQPCPLGNDIAEYKAALTTTAQGEK